MTEPLMKYHNISRQQAREKNLIFDMIKDYIVNGFYGKLEINFENGKVTSCKEVKSIKL